MFAPLWVMWPSQRVTLPKHQSQKDPCQKFPITRHHLESVDVVKMHVNTMMQPQEGVQQSIFLACSMLECWTFLVLPLFLISHGTSQHFFPEKSNVLWIRHVFVVSNHFLVDKNVCPPTPPVAGRSGIQVTPSLGETLSSLASTTRSCASVVALGNCLGWRLPWFVVGKERRVVWGWDPST